MDQVDQYLRMIIYGRPGVGKTVLAATAADVPEMRDVLMADVDNGTMSISRRKDIDRIPVTEYGHIARIKEFLDTHCRLRDAGDLQKLAAYNERFMGFETPEPRQYRTLLIDTVSEAYTLVMYQLFGIKVGNIRLDQEIPKQEWEHYRKAADMIAASIREFRRMPINLILTAHEIVKEDKFTGRQARVPGVQGQLSTAIQGHVDVVGWLTTGTETPDASKPTQTVTVRRMFLQPRPTTDAKNRIPGFSKPYVDSPTMEKFYNALRENSAA